MVLSGDIEQIRAPSAGQNAATRETNIPALYSAVRPFLAELRGRQHESPPSCLPLLEDQPETVALHDHQPRQHGDYTFIGNSAIDGQTDYHDDNASCSDTSSGNYNN